MKQIIFLSLFCGLVTASAPGDVLAQTVVLFTTENQLLKQEKKNLEAVIALTESVVINNSERVFNAQKRNRVINTGNKIRAIEGE